MQRLDHGMIYLLIAGTYAPICLVALPKRWGIPLFASIGAIGLLGMVIKLAAIQRLQWLAYALYPVMGWAAVIATPALRSSMSPLQIGLVIGGGVAYTAGFPVLLLKRPDPWPQRVRLPRGVARVHRAGGRTALRCRCARRVLSTLAFDRYVVVDWSARSAPATGADSIWIADLAGGEVELANPPTRRRAADRLHEILDGSDDDRVLLGFDASLGYPSGTAALLGLSGTPWHSTWQLIADLSTDDERNRNNRFGVAAELNRRSGLSIRPVLGMSAEPGRPPPGSDQAVARSSSLSSDRPSASLRHAGLRPASCWQLLGAGSVGSQTLTLLPLLTEMLSRRRGSLQIWPFTTGLDAPRIEAGSVAVAEIWPTLFPVDHGGTVVKDAAQVRDTALALRTLDASGELASWFAPRLSGIESDQVVAEEGWVLGAGVAGVR